MHNSRAEYSSLPVTEDRKDEDENPVKVPKRLFVWLGALISVLLLAIAFVVLGRVDYLDYSAPSTESVVDQEATKSFHDHLARAGGDEYLIGVGKADITG